MYVCVCVVGKGARLEEIDYGEEERGKKLIKGNFACMRSGIDGFKNRADSLHSSQKMLIHINTIC